MSPTSIATWPAHLGSLHPVETLLTLVLAFGPFVALGIVWFLRRSGDEPEDQRER